MSIYYSPEDYGLETVGAIEWSEPDYSFDMTAVWKKARGEYYFGSDSGCSCPSPFEDVGSLTDLNGPYTKKALEYNLKALIKERTNYRYSYDYSFAELTKQLRDILDRLK